MPAISVNLIVKDQPQSAANAVASLTQGFLREGDEVVVVDTGSREANFSSMKRLLETILTPQKVCLRLVRRPDLSHELKPYIDKWLPEHVGKIEQDNQYHDLRGILDFSEARNVALKESSHDRIFWIDSDDVLEEDDPGNLRQLVDQELHEDKHHAIFLDYLYSFDERDGSLTTVLKRERAALKDKYEWRGKCHETLCPLPETVPGKVGYWEGTGARIRHTEARKKNNVSDVRNYVIMRREIEEGDGDPDPRTIFYLANAARGLGRWREATRFYKYFDTLSGSIDDRFATATYMSNIYMQPNVRRPLDALDWSMKAIDIKPRDPRGYFGVSRAMLARHRYQEALDWFEMGARLPYPGGTLHTVDPTHILFHPYLVAAEAAEKLGDKDRAMEYARALVERRPNLELAKNYAEYIQNWAAGKHLTECLQFVAQHIRGGGPNARRVMQSVLDEMYAVPKEAEDLGLATHEPLDPREKRPELLIFCGNTPETWGPESAKTGIGGSEKMVLILAPELQERGWNVTVAANVPPDQRGVHEDGVRWVHFAEVDDMRSVDVLVAWRNPQAVKHKVGARKRVIWLHDVPNPKDYDDDVLALADHVICESECHARPLRGTVPDRQIAVLRNAIVRQPWADVERDPKRVIYLSSPDRGLTTAARMVAGARAVDPEIKMTVLYGFSPYERKARVNHDHRVIPDLGREASVDDYERYVGRVLDDVDAEMLFRVGFDEVWENLCKSGIWLYPTRFWEISCMSAMEAMAAGLVCVTSEYAALSETLAPNKEEKMRYNLGTPDGSEKYIRDGAEAILGAASVPAKDPGRVLLAHSAGEAFDVKTLADQWADLLGDSSFVAAGESASRACRAEEAPTSSVGSA